MNRIGWPACMLWALSTGIQALAADALPATDIAVLNGRSYLRAYLAFRAPVVATQRGEIKTATDPNSKEHKPFAEYESPPPPAGWIRADFDDSAWDRQRAPVELGRGPWASALHSVTPNSLICLRGKFVVEDPARAGNLTLSLEYVGGAAVYLNGQEIKRGHLPEGELKPETLAEKYPDDLYCEPDGTFQHEPAKNQARFDRRYRKLSDVAVPAKLLVKGVNVLAIELHRAPINEGAIQAKRKPYGGGSSSLPDLYACVGLKSLALQSVGSGVIPNTARPKGIQVWNVAPSETVTTFDYGDPGCLLPVSVAAARNSVFSGRLAVSADSAIQGLKVTVGGLKAAGGAALPASAVRVRYAEPAAPDKTWVPVGRFEGLVDALPASIPVGQGKPPAGLTPGAVASLWFTVKVPKDAKAGKYEGTIAVEAQGLAATAVPLVVTVHDWTMPDPKDFRQHHMIRLEQEASAFNAGVPLWSDEHFKRMGQSLALMAEVNNRLVPVNLARMFYGGNTEGMVRWVKQPDGSFKYDYSILDKYLDLVARTIGKPLPLQLNCWGELGGEGSADGQRANGRKNFCVETVSVFDPVSNKVETLTQPLIGTEESYVFWKPVIDEVLQKVEARGWTDAAAFGHNSYCYLPAPRTVSVARKLWPEGVWSFTAHSGGLGGSWKGAEPGVAMPVKYSSAVWTEGPITRRGARALCKPRPAIWNAAVRARHWDWSPIGIFRNLPEEAVLRGHDGLSDFGADNVPFKDARGRFVWLPTGRGTGGGGGSSTHSMLAAAADGIVATERFEMLREGTEFCEAVLYIEKALLDKKVSGELERKANDFLDRRGQAFVRDWYNRGYYFRDGWSVSGQMESDAQLLELAAQIAAEDPAK